MKKPDRLPRREFMKQVATAAGALIEMGSLSGVAVATPLEAEPPNELTQSPALPDTSSSSITYPRVFEDRHLKMIAFPLGGVAAGSLSLGGRGQLRDWEIFNRPNVGYSPSYAFPAIWVQAGNDKPIAHVLESRILPPYEGQDGLGSNNSPGLSRLEAARFTAEFPLAHLQFMDQRLPVQVELEAFSPFIPHDPNDSGLPAAILRYRVTNSGSTTAKVSIAYSIENPVIKRQSGPGAPDTDKRLNMYSSQDGLAGLLMTNPGLSVNDPMNGSFLLAALPDAGVQVEHWRGWPKGGWWNSPLHFWDAFSSAGSLGTEPESPNLVGTLCQRTTIPAGQSVEITFMLAWHFPNRTPNWCGWASPKGEGDTLIGNFYATRFKDAWEVAQYTTRNLQRLEQLTRLFAKTMRESTLPAVVKEAATANLSTLVSTTCFRTADGEFHGFEGSDDKLGCCYGNCTHVWNYETATTYLFPSFSRSLRKAAFGYSLDPEGALRARQVLPDGKERDGIVATDGQMGEIIHAYLDWKQTGDMAWLGSMWPQVKRAVAFAWSKGSWDSAEKGVSAGVQNNTYDVAFLGPNPMCGIYYLGALRASEEMARAMGDTAFETKCRMLFRQGSSWTDQNLFNGDFYVQKIQAYRLNEIDPVLQPGLGGGDPEKPQYQVGEGCLIDQLIGQYLASVGELGPLVSTANLTKTLQSIYAFNYKRSLENHNNVERTFALNDEAAMVICDYGNAERPRVPFPYFAEVMTGFEYSTAALMIYSGMVEEGIECIGNIRARYDGEKRNPWDEAECGHHYARAMASWSGVVATSGFHYDGAKGAITAVPRVPHGTFQSIWATGTGWGTFRYSPPGNGGTIFELEVLFGKLPCRAIEISGQGTAAKIRTDSKALAHTVETNAGRSRFVLREDLVLATSETLRIEVGA
jgi:non-lysosomal glucosylceramidase